MSGCISDTEDLTRKRVGKSTKSLLARLYQHHDYSVTRPEGYQKPAVVEIKSEPEVNLPIEVCVLPIPEGKLTADGIKRVVCRQFGLTNAQISSQRRCKKIVQPRQIAMYLCRERTTLSFPQIGRKFGDRDHTTVLHAANKITSLIRTDWKVAHDVAQIEAQL